MKLTKAQIEVVKNVFAAHPKVDELLMTEDGNCFLKQHQNAAYDHNRKLEGETKVVTVSRDVLKVNLKPKEEKKEGSTKPNK